MMTGKTVAYFGHDADHAVVIRRIAGLEALGYPVTSLSMRRRTDENPLPFAHETLGIARDGAFARRALSVAGAAAKAARHPGLRDADLIWARNLDMLMIALSARRIAGSRAPVIYETLDIHHSLTGKGAPAKALRAVEGRLLSQVERIIVSSPGFTAHYFDKVHPEHPPVSLIENVLTLDDLPPRPAPRPEPRTPLRLGWVGVLRCTETFAALKSAAAHFDGRVEIIAHGRPSATIFPDFERDIADAPHMRWAGPYDAATDLPSVYGDLDLVWAGVTYQSEGNAKWLLPCRAYEAGYFGVPALGFADTETGRFLTRHGSGLTIGGDIAPQLIAHLDLLLAPGAYGALTQRLAAVPTGVFARGTEDLEAVLQGVLP